MSSASSEPRPRSRGGRRLARLLDATVRTAGSPALDSIRPSLWRDDSAAWAEQDPDYRSAIMEQYKIYVEMADRISARRGLTNTFFLTLNTAIFSTAGALWVRAAAVSHTLLVAPWLALMVQCLAWFWLLRSYRQLNSAKYAVIGAFEERLPASPYWQAEWAALGFGRDPSRYWPLTHLEQLVPALFATTYTIGFVMVMLI